ncbi:MAG: NAD(P)/FAD-dependent oxidoreductase [Rhodospirillaceae bacterium]|nr:NAD(P)/FAD-dependent oxidoreductase [Rhodospirillaceae bacterium]
MTDKIDCAVIGAGVIGLAIARELSLAGREVVVLESADAIGTGTSSRNSEVIHAGLYYAEGSLKARLCVEGLKLLYAFLQERDINHIRCGKLIVATSDDELDLVKKLHAKGVANGVHDLEWLSTEDASALEPHLKCRGGLLSPSTGIFDSHNYMLTLQGDAENNGAVFAFLSRVTGGKAEAGSILLNVDADGESVALSCNTVINAAGLGAQDIAAAIMGMPRDLVPPLYYAKGNYFYLAGKAPFQHLIYPVPGAASLGLHYTRDLGGQGRFGPDVEWVDKIDYTVDGARADSFYEAIRRYWPELEDGALTPGYSGIRPKIQAPGDAAADFVIQGPDTHGIEGLVNLFGFESPGLTSSLAIAAEIMKRL